MEVKHKLAAVVVLWLTGIAAGYLIVIVLIAIFRLASQIEQALR